LCNYGQDPAKAHTAKARLKPCPETRRTLAPNGAIPDLGFTNKTKPVCKEFK
jgi:hypothetical protein